jgi:hypothetical protein
LRPSLRRTRAPIARTVRIENRSVGRNGRDDSRYATVGPGARISADRGAEEQASHRTIRRSDDWIAAEPLLEVRFGELRFDQVVDLAVRVLRDLIGDAIELADAGLRRAESARLRLPSVLTTGSARSVKLSGGNPDSESR